MSPVVEIDISPPAVILPDSKLPCTVMLTSSKDVNLSNKNSFDLTLKLPIGEVPPISSSNLTIPNKAFIESPFAGIVPSLLTAFAKVTFPGPVPVLMVILSVKVNAPAKLILVPSVVISPAKLLLPVPFCVNPSLAKISPLELVVNNPEFVISALPSIFIGALTVKFVPVKSNFPVKFVTPLKVLAPLPANCVKSSAVIPFVVTFFADIIVISPKAEFEPIAPETEISPFPAVKDRFGAGVTPAFASIELPKDIFELFVTNEVSFAKVTAPV